MAPAAAGRRAGGRRTADRRVHPLSFDLGTAAVHDQHSRLDCEDLRADSHADWAARERATGVVSPEVCATRKAFCEFRAGRYRTALASALPRTDAESRYWQARAAAELARAAFKQLDT